MHDPLFMSYAVLLVRIFKGLYEEFPHRNSVCNLCVRPSVLPLTELRTSILYAVTSRF